MTSNVPAAMEIETAEATSEVSSQTRDIVESQKISPKMHNQKTKVIASEEEPHVKRWKATAENVDEETQKAIVTSICGIQFCYTCGHRFCNEKSGQWRLLHKFQEHDLG